MNHHHINISKESHLQFWIWKIFFLQYGESFYYF